MDTKHLIFSKTFWLNTLGIVLLVGDVLPQKWGGPVLLVANILNRFLTTGNVTLSWDALRDAFKPKA